MGTLRPHPHEAVPLLAVPSGQARERWWTRGRLTCAAALAALVCAVVLLHGGALRAPLVGDDYFFLEKATHASFAQLVAPRELVSNFYRPWSRELHFAAIYHVAGLDPFLYHVVNLVLAVACLVLFFLYARRVAGARVAAVATASAVAFPAWSLFVSWASCSQDLWMAVWALLALHAATRERKWLTPFAFVLALLSKETAAALPLVMVAEARFIRRRAWPSIMPAVVPLALVLAVWAALHPLLGGGLWHPRGTALTVGLHPAAGVIVKGTLLSLVHLDAWPQPELGWPRTLYGALAGGLALLAFLWLAFRLEPRGAFADTSRSRARAGAVGVIWAVAMWLPLAMPTIGWHAYYGTFGALGAWLALAALLASVRPVAVLVVAVLVALGAARVDTPQDDWGTARFQRQAAVFIGRAHQQLLLLHPSLPRGSRLFFKEVPSGIGLVPGGDESPALRVWYHDPTLRAAFMSRFAARAGADTLGNDYFFRHDLERGWIEIHRGPEDAAAAMRDNPRWLHDHEQLATSLMVAGEWLGARQEFAKLSAAAPQQASYAFDLGLSHCALGEQADAARAFARVLAMPSADPVLRREAARGCR